MMGMRAVRAMRYGMASGGRTMVVGELSGGKLSGSTLQVLGAASQLGQPIDVLVAAEAAVDAGAVGGGAAMGGGVERVAAAHGAALRGGVAEALAPLVAQQARECGATHVFAAATAAGKNLMPRVAALLGVAPLSDVIAVKGPRQFERPVYAGNALATVEVDGDGPVVATVRPTAFAPPAEAGAAPSTATIEAPAVADAPLSQWEGDEVAASARPELAGAPVVVSGGRALKSKENFALVEALADKLGGAVGASRAAVDAGFAANDLQVGQTGKIVAPKLYIAIGISGQIQHVAGMKDSKVIVAINTDKDAPIFQIADYGLVGDLFEVLPELTEKI